MRNLIAGIPLALFSTFITVGADRPAAGTYYIYNRVLSPDGHKLAITFKGENNYATVNPLAYSTAQQWSISDYNKNTQALTPVNNQEYEAGWGSDGVIILPKERYVWIITQSNVGYYTIQDGGLTAYWYLDHPANSSKIIVGKDPESDTQEWYLKQMH